MSVLLPNPLLASHQTREAELQSYDTIEIVSTFGQPQAEYAAIRKAVAMLDMPFRGMVELTGADRHAFLDNLLSNQIYNKSTKTGLVAGQTRYAFLLNLKGRVVTDVNVLELGDRTLLEIDGRLAPLLTKFFERYLFAEKVSIASQIGKLHQIALHGPRVDEIISAECGIELLPANACLIAKFSGIEIILWRDDVCGVPGIHLVAAADRIQDIWDHLLVRHGQEISIGKRLLRPIGWAAFNTARVEAGRPLFGIDFELAEPSMPGPKPPENADAVARSPGVLPAETGQLARAVSFNKGCYLGQEVVARMHARGQVARQLVGIVVDDGSLPIAGQSLFDGEQNAIGVLTSSTMSPSLSDAAIGLAIVRKPFFEVGTALQIAAEGAVRACRVVALPFVKSE